MAKVYMQNANCESYLLNLTLTPGVGPAQDIDLSNNASVAGDA